AARLGADWAVAVIYRDLHPRLVRFFRSQESREADDLVGEVWLAVAQGLALFDGDEAGLRAWVFTIARRRLVDHRRRAAFRRTDAPPGYAGVAAVLGGSWTFSAVDDPREAETIAEIAAVVRSHQPAIALTPRSRSMSSRTHSAKVAVGVFAGVLSIAGVAAAAAGGHLPDAAQDAVSHAASH